MQKDILEELRTVATELHETEQEEGLGPDSSEAIIARLCTSAADEIEHLRSWVNDLQSGMYVNCVYCGHRYGPEDQVPTSMADALKQHVEQCPKHPMSLLRAELTFAQETAHCILAGALVPTGNLYAAPMYRVLLSEHDVANLRKLAEVRKPAPKPET